MKLKPNETLFDQTFSNLTFFFKLKTTKVFQSLAKSIFLIFMTKKNQNNGNETKSNIFFMGLIQI